MSKPGDPSLLVRFLVRLLIPRKDREFFLGDLRESVNRGQPRFRNGNWFSQRMSIGKELAGAIQLIGNRNRGPRRPRKTPGDNMLHELFADLRFGLRLMGRTPGFTAVAVLTMALGIGANTAIFSLVNGVLLRPLPYPEAERAVFLQANNLARGWSTFTISPLDFWDWQEMNRSTELMAAYRWTGVTYTGGDFPERLRAIAVSPDYLPILGGEPVIGRNFTNEDVEPGGQNVVLLSHGFWRSTFGGDPDIIGRTMALDGETSTIVGVVPPSWRHISGARSDVLLPLRPAEWWFRARGSHFLRGLARLSPGVTVEQAQADLSAVATALEAEYPETNDGWGAVVTPLNDAVVGGARPQLLVLLASVGLVLIIACANVAQMTLARASARGQEMAIRTALGAAQSRVVRQLLAESAMLSVFGGLLGIALAFGLLRVLVVGWPDILPRLEEVNIDGAVLMFTACLSLASGLLFGLFPAMSAAGSNIGEALRKASWSVTGDSARRRFRAGLVVAEVGLAVILLVGSGLLVRSLVALQNENPGFEAANTLAFSTNLPQTRYESVDEWRAYAEECHTRLQSVPGVELASVTTSIPISGQGNIEGLEIEGRPQNGVEDELSATTNSISPDYFDTMRIPLLAGRGFTHDDREESVLVAIVSESFANQHFPGESAVGKRISFTGRDSLFREIVGVVGDVQQFNVGRASLGHLYLPYNQRPDNDVRFVIRSSVPPHSLVGAVRTEIQTVDPEQPLIGITTLEQLIADDMSAPRFRTVLLGSFGMTALLLSVVGLYGVLSHTVIQRSREIGMRMALGAQRGAILRLIMRDGMPLVLAGVVIGLASAFALTRVLASMLFGIGTHDLGTFVAAPVLLVAVATVAVLVPAFRATRVDPVKILTTE